MDDDETAVVLRCFDGARLAVPASLARPRSSLVRAALAAAGEDGFGVVVVDVPGNVPGRDVAKVVAYWEARESVEEAARDVAAFDAGFLVGLLHDARVDLIHAAHHLADHALIDLFRFGPRLLVEQEATRGG